MKRALGSTLAIGALVLATLGMSAGTANAAPAPEKHQVCSSPNPNMCSSHPAPSRPSAQPGHPKGKTPGGGPGAVSSPAPLLVPVIVPVNVCGNNVNTGGPLNPAFGDTCIDG
jgi:hypothetical protein